MRRAPGIRVGGTRIGGLRAVEGPLQNATQDPRLRQGVEVNQPPAVENGGKNVENLCRINFYVICLSCFISCLARTNEEKNTLWTT